MARAGSRLWPARDRTTTEPRPSPRDPTSHKPRRRATAARNGRHWPSSHTALARGQASTPAATAAGLLRSYLLRRGHRQREGSSRVEDETFVVVDREVVPQHVADLGQVDGWAEVSGVDWKSATPRDRLDT